MTTRATRYALLGAALTLGTCAHATTTLTFDDDVALGPISHIVHPDGVELSSNPAGGASYGTGFVFGADFLQGAVIEISPGAELRIDFILPATFVQFGLLAANTLDITSNVSVELFTSEGAEAFPFVSTPSFSALNELQYTYVGGGLDHLIVRDYSTTDSVSIDNLTFDSVPVPAPGTVWLAAMSLVALWSGGGRRGPR